MKIEAMGSAQARKGTPGPTDDAGRLHPGANAPVAGLDLTALRTAIDARLSSLIPAAGAAPATLNAALRYSLLAPGKRLRPLLTMAAAAHFGAHPDSALDAGCAIEMVHTASLVLDDLPSMDNAHLRRGQATTHWVFGEDMAVLTAVTLLNRAYGTLAALDHVDPLVRLELVQLTEQSVGTNGLAAGQTRDLHERTAVDSVGKIEQINFEKTGVLFVLAVESGARIAGISDHRLNHLRTFARHLGCAFQTLDDVLDQAATTESTGKDVGKDGARLTTVTTDGVSGARALARKHLDLALAMADACPSEQPTLRPFLETLFAGVSA